MKQPFIQSQLKDKNFREHVGYKNGFILQFSEYLLVTHSVSGTVPGAENTSMNKTDKEDQRHYCSKCIEGPYSILQLIPSLPDERQREVNLNTTPTHLWSSLAK